MGGVHKFGTGSIAKGLACAVALCVTACGERDTSDLTRERLTADEVAALSTEGFALFECAALASRSEAYETQSESFFNEGYARIVRFIEIGKEWAEKEDPAFKEAVQRHVPLLVSFRVSAPTPDFAAGSIWEATNLFIDDQLNKRDTWGHQRLNPDQPPLSPELLTAMAEDRFREKNCELLLDRAGA